MIVDPNEFPLKPGSDAAEFYAHMGQIVSVWSAIEAYVFELFWFCLVTHKFKAAFLFERLGTIGPKLLATDELAKATLTPGWYKKWHTVYKQLNSMIEMRNRVAHNSVNKYIVGVGGPDKSKHHQYYRCYLETSRYKVHKPKAKYDTIDQLRPYLADLTRSAKLLSSLGVPRRARRKPETIPRPRFPAELFARNVQPK